MTYDVVFTLPAVLELIQLKSAVASMKQVVEASDVLRRDLETNPEKKGTYLSEGLYYRDVHPLRGFFTIDEDRMLVEITDIRAL